MGPSRASHSRAGNTSTAQPLSDLYNARHTQEANACSSSSSSRHASSSSLVELYNKRHHAEVRKATTSSSSLADLYNQRYESEHQAEDDSVEEVLPAHHRTVDSRPRAIARPAAPSARAAPKTMPRAISVDETSDEGKPEPVSLIQSESDQLEDRDNDDLHSMPAPTPHGRDASATRSDSNADLQESAELVYVRRSSIPRRGALRSSATRLTMDSDDEIDFAGAPEPELPRASASSFALARPHASPSKLVVPSSGNASLDPESSCLSTPPIPPHHRKGQNVPPHLLVSTQEEESLNSIIAAGSATESTRANEERIPSTSTSTQPRALSRVIGSSGEVVVSDSSIEDPISAMGSTLSRPTHSIVQRSSPEQMPQPIDVDAVVRQRSPTKTMQEAGKAKQTLSRAASERASPSTVQPASNRSDNPSEHDNGLVYDSASDAPVITNVRVAELQAAESSANATEWESDAQRNRYPRRARNVTDYNVKRAFERYERNQDSEDSGRVPTHATRPQKVVAPVIVASPQFFDALRSRKPSKSANDAKATPSFADFLLNRANPAASAGETLSTGPLNRNADSSATLTEAQARALLKSRPVPQTMCNILVNTQDRSSLFQLKPSTRRWLGIRGSGPLDLNDESSDDDAIESPRLPGTGTPIHLKLGAIIPTHRRRDKISPAELRDALEAFEGKGLIGRPIDATALESASRRLRLGRAYKLPLPHPLRPFADMEHQEWVRLEELLLVYERMVEEQQARGQGRIMVEVESSDTVQTQYDHLGRKRVSTLQLATGGTLKVYFNAESSDPVVPEDESQGYEIVRTSSPTKSPAMARLASVRPHSSQDAVEEAGTSTIDAVGGDYFSSATPEPSLEVAEATTSRQADVSHSKFVPTNQAHYLLQRKSVEPEPEAKKTLPAVTTSCKPKSTTTNVTLATSSKPKAITSKGTLDLLSYFSTQTSPSGPTPEAASTAMPVASSASRPAPASKSAKPTPTAPPLSAVEKGKQRTLDLDIPAWPSSSRSADSEVEVVIDLTQSSSTTESVGNGKRPRDASPADGREGKRKNKAVAEEGGKKVVGLAPTSPGRSGSKPNETTPKPAEAKRTKPARDHVWVPLVELGPTPDHPDSAKRKRASSPSTAHLEPSTPSRSKPSASPKLHRHPTPSPTRGGWKGISGWYANTRDVFSPTPEGGVAKKSDRELAKRQRQVKLDSLLTRKGKKRK